MKKYFVYVLALLAIAKVDAATVYESATGPFDQTVCCGSFVRDSQFIGSTFAITDKTNVDGIGGHFSDFSMFHGSIFGALVNLGPDGLPVGDLSILDDVITYTVFTPDSGIDTTASVENTILLPGTYGLVFGSGLFGADGETTLTLLQPSQATTSSGSIVSINNSSYTEWGFSGDDPNRYRMFVTGTTVVPVPGAVWLFSSAIALLAISGRRNGSLSKK